MKKIKQLLEKYKSNYYSRDNIKELDFLIANPKSVQIFHYYISKLDFLIEKRYLKKEFNKILIISSRYIKNIVVRPKNDIIFSVAYSILRNLKPLDVFRELNDSEYSLKLRKIKRSEIKDSYRLRCRDNQDNRISALILDCYYHTLANYRIESNSIASRDFSITQFSINPIIN